MWLYVVLLSVVTLVWKLIWMFFTLDILPDTFWAPTCSLRITGPQHWPPSCCNLTAVIACSKTEGNLETHWLILDPVSYFYTFWSLQPYGLKQRTRAGVSYWWAFFCLHEQKLVTLMSDVKVSTFRGITRKRHMLKVHSWLWQKFFVSFVQSRHRFSLGHTLLLRVC